jgi:hypothetical protein
VNYVNSESGAENVARNTKKERDGSADERIVPNPLSDLTRRRAIAARGRYLVLSVATNWQLLPHATPSSARHANSGGPSLTLPSGDTYWIWTTSGSPAGIMRVSSRSNRFGRVLLVQETTLVEPPRNSISPTAFSAVDVQPIDQSAKFLARFEEGNSLRGHFDWASGLWIASDAP